MAIPQTRFLPDQLEMRVKDGWLRKQTQGALSIYNYTEATQYGRHWDRYTRACRGLILDSDYNLVALPFEKFFNLGEPDCPALPDSRGGGVRAFDAYQKVDGSLGIWFYHDGAWRVATRGSFDNDYTVWALKNAPDLRSFPTNWTIMTEICMPADLDGMPRAVKHEPGVYFLGATDLYSLKDLRPCDAALTRWSGPTAKVHEVAGIDELTHRAKYEQGEEGWVVRYHTGLRVKIKTTWYLHLFRAISALNEKHVKELMAKQGLDAWLKDFPEELQAEAKSIYDGIQTRFITRRDAIMRDFGRINVETTSADQFPREHRKAFALAVKDHPEKPYMFMLLDGQNIDNRLLEDC